MSSVLETWSGFKVDVEEVVSCLVDWTGRLVVDMVVLGASVVPYMVGRVDLVEMVDSFVVFVVSVVSVVKLVVCAGGVWAVKGDEDFCVEVFHENGKWERTHSYSKLKIRIAILLEIIF